MTIKELEQSIRDCQKILRSLKRPDKRTKVFIRLGHRNYEIKDFTYVFNDNCVVINSVNNQTEISLDLKNAKNENNETIIPIIKKE